MLAWPLLCGDGDVPLNQIRTFRHRIITPYLQKQEKLIQGLPTYLGPISIGLVIDTFHY
jgi:hypothetical protein